MKYIKAIFAAVKGMAQSLSDGFSAQQGGLREIHRLEASERKFMNTLRVTTVLIQEMQHAQGQAQSIDSEVMK